MTMPKELRRFMRAYGAILTSIAMIGIAIAGTVWGIIPFGRRVWGTYQELVKIEAATRIMEAKYSMLSSISDVDLQRDTNELLRAIPGDKDVATAISTIEQTTNASGLSVESFTMENPGSLATDAAQRLTAEELQIGTGIVSTSIVVDGSMEQIKSFLDTLHKVRRLLRVALVDISVREDGVVRALLSIDAFFAPIPAHVGAIAQEIEPLSAAEEALLGKIAAYPIAYLSLVDAARTTHPVKQDPFSP